jgi:hypothetical protein
LLLIVLIYVLFVCKCALLPGVNQIAVDNYININNIHNINNININISIDGPKKETTNICYIICESLNVWPEEFVGFRA